MKIMISGSSGLIGQALIPYLQKQGHTVGRLLRQTPDGVQPSWQIAERQVDWGTFGEPQAIIHLAGESIADGRWSDAKKQRIIDSRVDSTSLLAQTICNMTVKPKVFISASGIGFYGNRGSQSLDEHSEHGRDFVSSVAMQWEQASQDPVEHAVRVVNLRTGIVLSPQGGALAKMLLPFKLGLGGRVGSGEQYMSWISLPDMVRGIEFLLSHDTVTGPVNMVSPNPVDNRMFAATLAKALHRPAIFPMPTAAVKLIFGEMGEELLLSSTRVQPGALIKMGFEFEHEQLESAFAAIL